MRQVISAKEFIKQKTTKLSDIWCSDDSELEKAMVEFARLHVKAALEAASQQGRMGGSVNLFPPIRKPYVDKLSILNAYPERNIK